MRQTIQYFPPLHLFYFALIGQLAEKRWETKEIFLDPYDFFFASRQGSKLEVIEKEIGGDAIPKHALISLPTTSPRNVSLRKDSKSEDNLESYIDLAANL
jgi:hypothetical protein